MRLLIQRKLPKFPVLSSTLIHSDLEGCGPLAAAVRRYQQRFTAPTERTPSRGSARNAHPIAATIISGGLEGYGPS